MDEHEFRGALRGVMVAGSPPPPMDPGAALNAARHARQRRRTMLTSFAVVPAIMAITVGAMLSTSNGYSRDDASGPPTGDTETVWPTGPDGQPQQDRTATAGPRADQAVRLETELAAAVPPGDLSVLPEQPPPWPVTVGPLRSRQAQFEERVDGREIWKYETYLTVMTVEKQTGRLFARVHTAGNRLPDDPCQAARTLWVTGDLVWGCEQTSDNSAVVTGEPGQAEFDQWAYYRHPDGTAVFVAQAREIRGSGYRALDEQPLTRDQLDAVAAETRFHLD
ncbi:MAG TPA: hypothetical protein VFV67_06540 [Actinophytocola sp.]|uniref:hypothetical protein n=1 Tax=Actinophytocola sp. TaxID=1872138 RepID=UPI002DB57704|nr:hypothetical protein [Actinophytocola sp.]HEU5470292.1 hypothetical protein [Actinophytocola sp.]